MNKMKIAFAFLLGGFMKMSVCLLAACKGIAKVFGYSDYRFLAIPLSFLSVGFSYMIYENIMYVLWTIEVWAYYAFLFQVIFPFALFVIAEIKVRKKLRRSART